MMLWTISINIYVETHMEHCGYLIDLAYNAANCPISPPSASFVVVADGLAHKASHCCRAAIATRIYLPPSVE